MVAHNAEYFQQRRRQQGIPRGIRYQLRGFWSMAPGHLEKPVAARR